MGVFFSGVKIAFHLLLIPGVHPGVHIGVHRISKQIKKYQKG